MTTQNSEILDRMPPCNKEAERGVLGSVLLKPEVLDELATVIRSTDFYETENAMLYGSLLEMHSGGAKIDLTLLTERLKKGKTLEHIGGVAYLAELMGCVPTAAHAVHYAEIVRDKATARELITAGTSIVQDAYRDELEPRDLLARAEQSVFGILESRTSSESLFDVRDVLMDAMVRMDARAEKTGGNGLSTGYEAMDRILGGMRDGELVILAARPSMGKTALALNIAENVAFAGKPVLFISLEMARLELADRLLYGYARVNCHHVRSGDLKPPERRQLVKASSELSQLPLMIDDAHTRTMIEIAATARRMKRKKGLGLVVIDYLQLIQPENSRDPREVQVAKVARRVKALARELSIPVLCLAQLNRQAESGGKAGDNRPKLSHLRESGAIEQDADVVMFVHRESYFLNGTDDGKAEVLVSKHRNGPRGIAKLVWLADYTRFENLATHQEMDVSEFGRSAF